MSLADAARPQLEAAMEVVRLHLVEGYTIADAAKVSRMTRAKAESALRFVREYLTRSLRSETLPADAGTPRA